MTDVSGILRDTQGNPLPLATVTLTYHKQLVGYEGGAVASNDRVFTTNGAGLLSMSGLVPGSYQMRATVPEASNDATRLVVRNQSLVVPDQDEATLEFCLTENVGEITPTLIQGALDAAEAAETAAIQAVAFGSAYTETDAELANITIPSGVEVLQRIPSASGQVAPQNTLTFWRRNASPGSAPYFTSAGGVTWTQTGLSEQAVLSTLTSALSGVITSGSTANGWYVRFADGTQHCWHRASASLSISNSFMGGFRSLGQTWTFPAAFTATPSVTITPEGVNSGLSGITTGTPGLTSANWAVTAFSSQGAATRAVMLTAVGRWL